VTDVQAGLASLLKELKLRNRLPMNMDVSKVGDRYWFVCHDDDKSKVISENSTTGFADDGNIALLKALSERVERLAFRSGYENKLTSCMTERSDGFAAYPLFYQNAVLKARESALAEAVERYVWAKWWDDETIAFKLESINSSANKQNILPYVSTVKNQCALEEIFVIEPKIENSNGLAVVILFGRLKSGGFISGGACGSIDDIKQTLLRSLDELYRHGLAIEKIRLENTEPVTFYEKRLAYFGLGHGNHLIRKRLEAKGSESIILPKLEIDEVVKHELHDLFQVHRCYFENQPPFVGGALERLCL
jgi:hypothetical protein